ncbi:hypothetical protein EIP86_008167 [Pleurotus ostreatoroseus]|nr:hypothetical protein EIP86_008167 [Pleurotus ostreatoroseus]
MKKAEDGAPPLPPGLYDFRLGVWRIVTRRSDTFHWRVIPSLQDVWKAWFTSLREAHVVRLLQDAYSLGPVYFMIAVSARCLSGLEEALSLWSLNRLLSLVESGYQTQHYDETEIMKALVIRVFFMCLITTWRWIAGRTNAILAIRMRLHLEERILRAYLSLDLTRLTENSETISADSEAAWDAFNALLGNFKLLFTVVSQVFLLSTLILSGKHLSIALAASILWPLYSALVKPTLWRKQYRKARAQAGDTSHERPWKLYSASTTPLYNIGQEILKDFPLICYTAESLWSHSQLSLASLATMQRLCDTLETTLDSVLYARDNLEEHLLHLKELYHDYEPAETKSELKSYSPAVDQGMEIELRNVTFHYPTSEAGETAIRDVSFSIPASSLVVIVGANGSGKSTLVNLLTGLHTPTSGEILVDGQQRTCYHKTDLQRSTALLAQDHNLFNLSVKETIGIGDPEAVDDDDRIREAARLGGSYAFIQKLNDGFDEFLYPIMTSVASSYPMDDADLKEILDGIEKQRDISGGEKQRLAASRTFMRIMSDKVKLVVVDEPTSAMDPLGEFELFKKLCAVRSGKTMVFVTHRFGHLTKHADLFL